MIKTAVIALCCLMCMFALATTAHAQDSGCQSCNRNAVCVGAGYGGCGCVSGYDPRTGGRRCAYCGFCLGFCLFPCGGGGASAIQAQPWQSNVVLPARVGMQSPKMGEVLDFIREKTGTCTTWRGRIVRDNGEAFDWSMLRLKGGSVFIIDLPDGGQERLAITEKAWALSRNGEIVAHENLMK